MFHNAFIDFSVENFKVFKEKAVFSMSSRKSDKHTFIENDERLLRISLIYGPNASGKTSILKGLYHMKEILNKSTNTPEEGETKLPFFPFLGDQVSSKSPTKFEITFSITREGSLSGVFRYGFSYTNEKIFTEKLIEISDKGEEIICFSRELDNIQLGARYSNESILLDKTKSDTLFLAVTYQFNNELSKEIFETLTKEFNVITGTNHNGYIRYTLRKLDEDKNLKEKILKYLVSADFTISDIVKDSTQEANIINPINSLLFKHPIFEGDNITSNFFDLNINQESVGTQRFFSVLGPLIDTLENGKVLFIDEFDNSLHPVLTKLILDVFASTEINTKNSQLIVTTHDTSLLSYKDEFIKDHFWFTEKDKYGAAKLFSLAEYKFVRNDTEYNKKYMEGRFGAVPIVTLVGLSEM